MAETAERLKIRGGGSSDLVGIICHPPIWDIVDYLKTGGGHFSPPPFVPRALNGAFQLYNAVGSAVQ